MGGKKALAATACEAEQSCRIGPVERVERLENGSSYIERHLAHVPVPCTDVCTRPYTWGACVHRTQLLSVQSLQGEFQGQGNEVAKWLLGRGWISVEGSEEQWGSVLREGKISHCRVFWRSSLI